MLSIPSILADHQYALVDRFSVGEQACEGLPIEPLIPTVLSGDAEKMPGLLALDPKAPYLPRLIKNIQYANEGIQQHLLSALLAVPPEIEQETLHDHLTEYSAIFLPRAEKYFLRSFDPRVFPHLVFRILNAKQVRCLFGPILAWTFRFQTEWVRVPVPEIDGPFPSILTASAEQRIALDDVIVLNAALLQREQALDREWAGFDEWRAAMEDAVVALQVARKICRLVNTDDLVAFVRHALLHGAFFYRHETIQRLLKDAIQHSYAARAALLKKEDWALIQTETHCAETPHRERNEAIQAFIYPTQPPTNKGLAS